MTCGSLWRSMVVLMILVAVTAFPERSRASDLEDRAAEAIRAYQEALGEPDAESRRAGYLRAELLFSQLESDLLDSNQTPSAAFYVNWGNAAMQSGQPGQAVVAFRRALALQPGNPRARSNLSYLRRELPEWAQPPTASPGLFQQLFYWTTLGSPRVRFLTASLLFLAACLGIASAFRFQNTWLRAVSGLAFAAWFVLMVPVMFAGSTTHSKHVVFVAEATTARAADSWNSSPQFNEPVPAGAEATIIEEREDWLHVQIHSDKRGWVPKSSIEKVEIVPATDRP